MHAVEKVVGDEDARDAVHISEKAIAATSDQHVENVDVVAKKA